MPADVVWSGLVGWMDAQESFQRETNKPWHFEMKKKKSCGLRLLQAYNIYTFESPENERGFKGLMRSDGERERK